MRIGCLQFAPQVGDIDNNLNRADAVLAKANQDDLDSLDILVLPELAFTGYAFSSLQEISPFLEPSGSGISALWARTTALKYNTNVLVGYPERVDVSPKWPTGPEYYNSSILVNGDGETIANYRKSFLYPLDETWALEGKHGFFGGHIPGLGRMAMGICMDINPYKFEAPWHAFEFGFHILEVRANLVVITMAWLTREECKDFTRMPNEPDMDTLLYWIQRLEPVIRDESGDEVIIVFCNRAGMEGNAVYAGTSAVVGIQAGEVKVYGLLGRGVKELLVVDTDEPAFANLVQREDAVEPDPQEHRPSSSGLDSGASSRSSKSRNGKRTEDKRTVTRSEKPLPREGMTSSRATESRPPTDIYSSKSRQERPSVRVKIPETQQVKISSTLLKTPIAESPTIPTPTAPSPTPLSARPKLVTSKSTSTSKHIDTPYPGKEDYSERDKHIFGGSVSILTEEEASVEGGQGLGSERYFWMPSSTLLHSPLDGPKWPVPDVFLPPQSPTVSAALVKNPSRNSHRTASSTLRDRSPRSEKSSSSHSEKSKRSGRSKNPRPVEIAPPTRPATTTGAAPMRPASPKSRNASRTGRHERRASGVEKPDLDDMIERLEALRRKTQSAAGQRQNHSSTPSQDRPRSPKSRNASRSGRPLESDISFVERALNISRGSITIGASESVLASNIPRPQSDILGKNNHGNGSAVRAPSRGHYHSSSDPDQPPSRSQGPSQGMAAPVAHIEPDESRTMLWSEISKIVGEHMGRPDSRESIRGRQRNDSIMSTQARQGSRGAPSATNRGAASQTRHGNGEMIRSVRDPSLGPPANPDDEIVAEIIFRRPGGPNHQNSRSNSTENNGTHGEGTAGTPSRRDPSRHTPESDSAPAKKIPSPIFKTGKKPAALEHDRKHSSAPPGRKGDERGQQDAACPLPALAGSSIHTLNSAKTSPTTPSPHAFEPSTPKAMILGPDYGSFLSTASDPLSNLRSEPLDDTLAADKTAAQIDRPRSAIW
ncbi:N-terminal amidase [Diaporthe helianthi]|uniref:N-terminal amidase n=1 Tax=Diaporthe helianthi TaxID=158607 RepID=A0A2P5IAT6_DIAHE|nr:N-terminal amidase [Diaporthe helianthi]